MTSVADTSPARMRSASPRVRIFASSMVSRVARMLRALTSIPLVWCVCLVWFGSGVEHRREREGGVDVVWGQVWMSTTSRRPRSNNNTNNDTDTAPPRPAHSRLMWSMCACVMNWCCPRHGARKESTVKGRALGTGAILPPSPRWNGGAIEVEGAIASATNAVAAAVSFSISSPLLSCAAALMRVISSR